MLTKSSKSRVWDIILLKDSGAWEGFRAPEHALRRTVNYIVVLLIVASLALVGWVWSRWELGNSQKQLAFAQLELKSLNERLESQEQGYFLGRGDGALEELTFFPKLGGDALVSEDLFFEKVSVYYDAKKSNLELRFELQKALKSGIDTSKLYWILLVHGAQGLRAFPPVLGSRQGSWINPQRGQVLEGLKKSRRVRASFRLSGFFEDSGNASTFVTLLLYDAKGSLLLKQQEDVLLREAGG